MKSHRIIITLAFIASLSYTCTSKVNNKLSPEEKILYDLNVDYDSIKEFFGNYMVNHFPENIDKNTITFNETLSPLYGNLKLILIRKSDSLLEKQVAFQKKSLAIYSADDTCMLVVNRFRNKSNYRTKYHDLEVKGKDLKVIDLSCYKDKYPVPNFWRYDFTTEETQCRLPEDFELFVLEAKPGQYFDEEYLTNGKLMPEKWENGYSKGVAISEKREVIIYWIIAW